MTTDEPQEPDVVKSIDLHSGARSIVIIAMLAWFGFLGVIIAANAEPLAAVIIFAGTGLVVILLVYALLWSPYQALITTRGKIRFDSLISKAEYDIEKIKALRLVEESEGGRSVRLEFSDGKSYDLIGARYFHQLATAIREVNPSVTILSE